MANLKENATANLTVRRMKGETIAEIADEIVAISAAIKRLMATRLTDATLLLLIQDAMPRVRKNTKKMPTAEIQRVLQGIYDLELMHLKPKEKK